MKMKSKFGVKLFTKASLLALAAMFPCIAAAQQQVTPYGQSAVVMNAVTTPVATPTGAAGPTCHPPIGTGLVCEIQSLGQNVHYLTYTTTGTGIILDLRLEASFTGLTGSFFPISADATNASPFYVNSPVAGALCASGYYPYIRANLIVLQGAAASVTALYSGTSSTSGCPKGTYNPSQDQSRVALPYGTPDADIGGIVNTPFGNSYGTLYVYTAGLHSGASIGAGSIGTGGSGVFNPTNANSQLVTQQLTNASNAWYALPLPYAPAQQVDVSFISGGASGGSVYAFIVFAQPAQDSGNLGLLVTTATSISAKTIGVGTFFSVSINQIGSSDATITIYDGTLGSGCSGTILAGPINAGSVIGTLWYNQQFYNGLCVTTTGGTPANITVNYR